MADVLRSPWMLGCLEGFLGNGSCSQFMYTPRLVQLVEFTDAGNENHAIISDRYNYMVAIFLPGAVSTFKGNHEQRSIQSTTGGILKLVRYSLGFIPSPSNRQRDLFPPERIIIMCIEEFEFLGSEGCSVHGDPRYIMAVPRIQELLHSNPRHPRLDREADLSATLDPEELFFLGTACTQSPLLLLSDKSFPEIIRDADCIIPSSQLDSLEDDTSCMCPPPADPSPFAGRLQSSQASSPTHHTANQPNSPRRKLTWPVSSDSIPTKRSPAEADFSLVDRLTINRLPNYSNW